MLVIAPTTAFNKKRKPNETPEHSANTATIVEKKINSMIPAGGANKNRFHSNGPKRVHDMETQDKGAIRLDEVARDKYEYDVAMAKKSITAYPDMGEITAQRHRMLHQI